MLTLIMSSEEDICHWGSDPGQQKYESLEESDFGNGDICFYSKISKTKTSPSDNMETEFLEQVLPELPTKGQGDI